MPVLSPLDDRRSGTVLADSIHRQRLRSAPAMVEPQSSPANAADASAWDEVEQVLDLAAMPPTAMVPADAVDAWVEVEAELSQIVESFQDLQDDLHYQQAQEALRDLIRKLNLTNRERTGLEESLKNLTTLLDKLENTVIQIAVFGMVGRGKSSLLNALVGQDVFATGPTHGVTQQVETIAWAIGQAPEQAATALQQVSLTGMGNSKIELIDTPGLDEVEGAARADLAQQLATQVDLVLFVITGDMTQVEHEALLALRAANKPILLVFNKADQYPEVDQRQIYNTLLDDRLKGVIGPEEIVMAAADPLVVQAIPQADGEVKHQLVRGQPQVGDLKLKILDLLQREGKALVALNTLIYAQTVSTEILERKRQICDRIAEDTIWNAAMIKAVAVALNPITVLDLLGGAVIDVVLVVALSRLYGLPMGQPGAIRLVKQIALGLGGLSASELLVTLGLSSLKGVLGATAVATGGVALAPYVPVAITQASVAGVFTYSIGQITKTYLINGATWGPDGPNAVIQNILTNLDESSILNRIKGELWAKLSTTSPNA
jgi:GTP-binding protein Era